MRYLDTDELIQLQARVIAQSGGGSGILDRGKIESAAAAPQATFGGVELYPTVGDKAAILGFSLTCNHGFVDGNKRIGHAAMETFLVLNGFEIDAAVDVQERMFLDLAAGQVSKSDFTRWVQTHIKPLASGGGSTSHGP